MATPPAALPADFLERLRALRYEAADRGHHQIATSLELAEHLARAMPAERPTARWDGTRAPYERASEKSR